MRKTPATSNPVGHPVGRRQFLTLSAAGLAAAGLPRAARAQGKRSGELVAGLSERMLTLDPANHYSISATSVLRHIFDPLVDVTNDSKFVPALAESWRRGQQHHLALHSSARASPSTTARRSTRTACVYTLKRVQDNTKLIKSFVYQDIESVEKDGDYAVLVTSKRPFGSLPAHLTMLGMLPASAGKDEDAFFQKPIGTGPVPLRELDPRGPDRARPRTRATGSPASRKVEKVTFRFIPELSTPGRGPARGRDPRDRPRHRPTWSRRSRAAAA